MPDFNEPQPDMILFKTEAGTRRQHASPQEIYLVIEVSDTTVKYDSEKKLLAYENARIPEYWIVDVPAKAVRVFRLNQGKKYQEPNSDLLSAEHLAAKKAWRKSRAALPMAEKVKILEKLRARNREFRAVRLRMARGLLNRIEKKRDKRSRT